MKKILSLLVLLLMVGSAAYAQYMLKVKYKDGTHHLYEIDCTESMDFEKDFSNPQKVLMSVRGRLAGKKNTWSLSNTVDNIEQISVVGTEPVAPAEEQSTFVVDEQTSSINMVNYSIQFSGSTINGQKTLTVHRIDNAMPPADFTDGVSYMATYDFDLEGIHDLNGTVEIRFPMSNRCFAAYHNKETGEWEPVLNYYDDKTKEMVIISDHLSEFCVFDVTDEHKRTAKLKYWGFDPVVPKDIEKVAETFAKVAQADDPAYAAIDAFANDEFSKYSLGLSVGMTPIAVGGFDLKLLNGYSDLIGKMGQAWCVVQFANTLRGDDNAEKATAAVKTVIELVLKPALEKKLFAGNFLFPACMTAMAVLEFQINWFAEEVHNTATTLYADAYKKYFYPGSTYPSIGGYGYRSAVKWYELISGMFTDNSLDHDDMKAKIDELVSDYVNQPWNDTDGFTWAVSDCRGLWPFWAEITNADRKMIAEEHRKELYTGKLKSVITAINNKYLCKSKEKFDEVYRQYANMMNKVVVLKFKDSAMKEGEKSRFAGCTIRFATMPSTVVDPEKWECVIKDNGNASIQYRMYPYLVEGFKNILEVVDGKGDVVGNIDIEGIQDVGKYYEATFDLSNNEVLALEDKWDISIKPTLATRATPDASGRYYTWGPIVFKDSKGFESHARGIVPGDIYNIYGGITNAFENRTLSLDAEGNFSIQIGGLDMTGNVNTRTGMGTGKFKLKANSSGKSFVTEEEAFDDWFAFNQWVNDGNTPYKYVWKNWTELEHFDADFSVEGTLDIRYSDLMKRYILHLDGIGSFKLDGAIYSSGSDIYYDVDENGKIMLKYHSKSMKLENIFVKDGTFTFSPALIYE